MNRYLISKGWEGFADRLQCLSYCIVSAKRFNRILYVDWTDTIWGEGFYKYFNFVDLPHVIQDIEIPPSLDIYPKKWQHRLMQPSGDWTYDIKEELEFEPMKGKHFEEIWVYSGIGYREWDMIELAKHLRLNKPIAKLVQEIQKEVNLPVVHLRGTDRAFKEENWKELRDKVSVALIISDDSKLTRRWMDESPKSKILSEPIEGMNHKSLINKHKMNIALITDFFVLASAKETYALNEDSCFYKMARVLYECEDLKKIFKEI